MEQLNDQQRAARIGWVVTGLSLLCGMVIGAAVFGLIAQGQAAAERIYRKRVLPMKASTSRLNLSPCALQKVLSGLKAPPPARTQIDQAPASEDARQEVPFANMGLPTEMLQQLLGQANNRGQGDDPQNAPLRPRSALTLPSE